MAERRRDALPRGRDISHIDALWIQAGGERAVEDPEVTGHGVRRHRTLQGAREGN